MDPYTRVDGCSHQRDEVRYQSPLSVMTLSTLLVIDIFCTEPLIVGPHYSGIFCSSGTSGRLITGGKEIACYIENYDHHIPWFVDIRINKETLHDTLQYRYWCTFYERFQFCLVSHLVKPGAKASIVPTRKWQFTCVISRGEGRTQDNRWSTFLPSTSVAIEGGGNNMRDGDSVIIKDYTLPLTSDVTLSALLLAKLRLYIIVAFILRYHCCTVNVSYTSVKFSSRFSFLA